MNLEEITKSIENLVLDQKSDLNIYDKKIAELQAKKAEAHQSYQRQIDAAMELQKMLLGDAESIETESFIISKKRPNLKSKAAYKLQPPTDKKEKERFIRYLKEEHAGLLKEETTYKLIANDTKQLIIDGIFHMTDEGLVVDDNGMTIPYLKAEVKPVEVRVKVKEK